jgi:methionyl-tRNA formyltransferase
MKDLRIVFLGTPEFAVPSLEKLIAGKFKPVGVVTAPDRPAGRGRKLKASPVKEAAVSQGIPVLQPEKLRSPEFMQQLQALNPNLFVVVAFRMLPESIWSFPEYGTFNLHASLLPDYRGAAPINWAIINGEEETGVTTFFIRHEIDTGDIILQEKEAIDPEDTAGSLYERLMHKGADLVLRTVEMIAEGDVNTVPQYISGEAKSAPKIFKETCEIDWDQSKESIINFVRGLSPYPAAWTILNDIKYKIFHVRPTLLNFADEPAGTVDTDQATFLHIKCQDAWLAVEEFQPEGKKRMKVADFFRGNKL